MTRRPKVSIGLPVFNGEDHLARAVDSILEQSLTDLELIIVDNASTDATQSIGERYTLHDERVRYVRNETNIGASRNYNKAFALAEGEYFKWAAHDDECHPEMLRRCAETLDEAPDDVVMVYPLGELIDEDGETLTSPLDRIESRDSRPHRRVARVLRSLNMCDPIFGVYRSSSLRETQLIGSFCGPTTCCCRSWRSWARSGRSTRSCSGFGPTPVVR